MTAAEYLYRLPERARAAWQHEFFRATSRHEPEAEAQFIAWSAIGVSSIPVDGRFVPVREALGLGPISKGDLPGHPFRGNQWTDGQGGGEDDGKYEFSANQHRERADDARGRAEELEEPDDDGNLSVIAREQARAYYVAARDEGRAADLRDREGAQSSAYKAAVKQAAESLTYAKALDKDPERAEPPGYKFLGNVNPTGFEPAASIAGAVAAITALGYQTAGPADIAEIHDQMVGAGYGNPFVKPGLDFVLDAYTTAGQSVTERLESCNEITACLTSVNERFPYVTEATAGWFVGTERVNMEGAMTDGENHIIVVGCAPMDKDGKSYSRFENVMSPFDARLESEVPTGVIDKALRHEISHAFDVDAGCRAAGIDPKSLGANERYQHALSRLDGPFIDTLTDEAARSHPKLPFPMNVERYLHEQVTPYSAGQPAEAFAEALSIYMHPAYGKKPDLTLPKWMDDYFAKVTKPTKEGKP
jgi:hypothetical protein